MIPHDILTLYTAKAIEYLVAVAFIVCFVPFWRYAMGARLRPAEAPARVRMPGHTQWVEWFRVSPDVVYHPGHAWARADRPELVTVGMDDFAQKLVGPIAEVSLPHVGTRLSQGEPAWSVRVDGQSVPMLSPIDGIVAAVNPDVVESPDLVQRDPYGDGWLVRVHAPRAEGAMKGLLQPRLARRWIEEATNDLRRLMAPELGLALQDGGVPVDGLARAIDPAGWRRIARAFLLT
jgi:glycine cleavage system H protein